MKNIVSALCFLSLISSCAAVDVVSSFTCPADYAGGLAWDGTYLWTGGGYYYDVHFYQMEIDGDIVEDFVITQPSQHTPRGFTYDGTNLFVVMEQYGGTPGEICEYTTGGDYLSQFTGFGIGCYGLTYDGGYLWVSSYDEHMIYKGTTSGELIDSFPSPLASPKDMAFDGTNLWVCSGVWLLNITITGDVIDAYDLSEIRLGFTGTGLTYDGNHIWIIERVDDVIYELNIPGSAVKSVSLGQIKAIYR